ncbi:hypothetical protein GLYMA_20G195050v4 [Glycine max]|nr:hypothetical protein GLYMA_20G195050v4 [Glycine max]KAH1036955.1 hypothetical protein GYH30_056395 [Glycine max]
MRATLLGIRRTCFIHGKLCSQSPMHASTFDFSGLKLTKVKGELLLKKHGEEGGDDIDHDRRLLSSSDDYTSGKLMFWCANFL